jgi:hypothetical protein
MLSVLVEALSSGPGVARSYSGVYEIRDKKTHDAGEEDDPKENRHGAQRDSKPSSASFWLFSDRSPGQVKGAKPQCCELSENAQAFHLWMIGQADEQARSQERPEPTMRGAKHRPNLLCRFPTIACHRREQDFRAQAKSIDGIFRQIVASARE